MEGATLKWSVQKVPEVLTILVFPTSQIPPGEMTMQKPVNLDHLLTWIHSPNTRIENRITNYINRSSLFTVGI